MHRDFPEIFPEIKSTKASAAHLEETPCKFGLLEGYLVRMCANSTDETVVENLAFSMNRLNISFISLSTR